VLNNSNMAIEIPHMKLSHDKHIKKTRDLGGNYANLAKTWRLDERIEDPADVANAVLRARRATEDGRTALLEFITSAKRHFPHRNGAAA